MRVVCARDETYPWAGLAPRRGPDAHFVRLRYFARENAWTGGKRRDNAHLRSNSTGLARCNICVTFPFAIVRYRKTDILRVSFVYVAALQAQTLQRF